ncbi:aminoglycoside phosphotransferase family protein [Kordiimonas sp.]|uniref:aminoglycoside phosphotransferase family protein n=1 Tax=Kordiimonas sp. TaxID=1970157 RepID=UPI003A93AA04
MADGTVMRADDQLDFLRKHGWGSADITPLIPDASYRSYKRLTLEDECRMLMDAPPPRENLNAYLDMTTHLKSLGLRVPDIFAEDRTLGYALIEDFGDDTFTRLLEAGTDARALYLIATDILIKLHSHKNARNIALAPYDMPSLLREAALFVDWFVPAVRGQGVSTAERTRYMTAFEAALGGVAECRDALVLRDFHVDNLMIVGGTFDTSHCGLLDYQDALIGSPAYDVISLIEDARCDVGTDIRAAVLERYFKGVPGVDREAFTSDMMLLGAQRSAKIAGLFIRLSRRDNKHIYLKHLPRVNRHLNNCLQADALEGVREAVYAMLPGFPDVAY